MPVLLIQIQLTLFLVMHFYLKYNCIRVYNAICFDYFQQQIILQSLRCLAKLSVKMIHISTAQIFNSPWVCKVDGSMFLFAGKNESSKKSLQFSLVLQHTLAKTYYSTMEITFYSLRVRKTGRGVPTMFFYIVISLSGSKLQRISAMYMSVFLLW